MSVGVNRFYRAVTANAPRDALSLLALFVYFLTEEQGEKDATAKGIDDCFRACDLRVPSRTARYLSENAAKGTRFVKTDGGYRLERRFRDSLKSELGVESIVKETSAELRALELKLPTGSKRTFLSETIDCFEIGAYRAAIVMCWLLTLDHLHELVLKHHLGEFNSELAKVTDKRVKVSRVSIRDDFSDIPENKFIELLRSSGVVSNDVRKILDEKLGTRNSCAHPSAVTIKRSKVIDFVDDLVENVLLKYPA